MVNICKEMSPRSNWSKDIMQTAMNLCRAGECINGTAKKYGLAYLTLYRHIKNEVASVQFDRFRP